MPILRVVNIDRRKTASCFLNEFKKDVYSQSGEDGIIEKIFEIIGAENRWCVEFGAWDGIHLSNTCNLIKNSGWKAVQIEAHPGRFDELKNNFADYDDIYPIKTTVGFERGKNTIDDILREVPIPVDFDLISIDVDGNDFHVWNSIVQFRPRVVVIEFNPTVPNDVIFVQDQDMSIHQGQSLAALIDLGKRKKYELVAVTNCNAFFVLAELYRKFKIHDNSIDAMRQNVPGRIFHAYDGTIYNFMRPLQWTGNPIRPRIDQFQVLSPEERVFYDKLPETGKNS